MMSHTLTLLMLSLLQSALLAMGQVLLKVSMVRMEPFAFSVRFFRSLLLNWPFALCGICFGGAALLWMYIVRHFPLSQAYPLVSMSYVFGMIAAVVFFHETVETTRWVGVLFIMIGCALIIR